MIPLSVRVGDTGVTTRLDDLSPRKTVQGAAECSFRLAEHLSAQFAAFERADVFDNRTTDVIWQGRLEDPGRSTGSDGDRWDMSAIGEQARTRDRSAALIYVDTDLSHWSRDANSSATSGSSQPTSSARLRSTWTMPSASKLNVSLTAPRPRM